MSRVSAKLKLALWTTLLMALMAAIVFILIFSFGDSIIESNSKTILSKVVFDNADELEFDDGEIEIDDIDFFKNSVYTLIYTEDGEHIAGSMPEEFTSWPQFEDKKTTERTIDGTIYYIYDLLSPVEDYKNPVWVRGVIAVDEVASATNSILQIAIFALPLIILLGGIGSYFIAKKTFRPIDKIIKTSKEISESENLSLRIGLESGSSEIIELSESFDNMFLRLETAFEAEKEFTSDVSHELRTPTAVIVAQCEYALSEKAEEEDLEEALQTIQKQAVKMSNLISNLLNLSRLDRGIEKIETEKGDMSQLVLGVCEDFTLIAPDNIKLNYNIAPNIIAPFNYSMLTRLLTNLINNAFRYGKEDGNVWVSLTESEDEIILSVKDDGIGIANEDQPKIWKRFYQVDPSRTTSQSGNVGLGLAMVLQIAKLHNAKVELISELGEGSIFKVKFLK